MSNKKTNPQRIPASISEVEARKLIEVESDKMLLYSWAIVLCALAGWQETTADDLLEFCENVNRKSSKLRTARDVRTSLGNLEALTGRSFPFYNLVIEGLHSKKDIERLKKRARISAMHSMFALIADSVTVHQIMEEDRLRSLFLKVHSIEKAMMDGEISFRDLLWVLEEEYALQITVQGTEVILSAI